MSDEPVPTGGNRSHPSASLPRRERFAGGLILALSGLAIVGCGSSGDQSTAEDARPAAAAADFPAANGQTLVQFAKDVGLTNDLVVSPAGSTYTVGPNRFSFGVFETDRTQVQDAQVAIYAAPGPSGAASGPFPARVESLQTDPAFAARTTTSDPDAATVAYVSDLKFDRPGEWRLVAVIKQGDSVVASLLPSIEVGSYSKIPDVGEMAPRVHTPTVDDVGDISEIDTRVPPDTMHADDLYDVLGKQPVVLLFATPALCQSRVCGPVVDIAEQVNSETGNDVAFIHQEVFVQNDPNKGIRPQLKAFGLETEPWLFVLDRSGRVSTRIEGALSVADLREAVAKAQAG